jgi:virginiamycin B lyase
VANAMKPVKAKRRGAGPRPSRRRPVLEHLEDRCLPATVTELPVLPTANAAPTGITNAADGSVWFTERSANKLGRLDTQGHLTEYTIPTAGSAPEQITTGADGFVWFTEKGSNKIGRLTADGTLTELALATASSQPFGITRKQDGTLWFTEQSGDRLGEVVV